jgi:hypothetical protein
MRCRTCDYPLWNLKTRQCPECGSPFLPGDYEFQPNSVRFCCPQCDQAYYGIAADGHLVPEAFDCVTCGRHVHMNEMVLLPAEGLEEKQTQAASNPWLERHREGWFRSWFATIGRSLVGPGRLIRGTPVESGLGHAWWFLTATVVAILVVSFIPAMCLMVGFPYVFSASGPPPGAPSAGFLAAVMAGTTVVSFLLVIPLILLYVLLWGLVAHGLLRLGGPGHETIRRTFQALCYSSGTYVTSVVPCLGGWLGPGWWVVSAVLMARAGHKVSGVRATFAVATFPVVLTLLFVAAYIVLLSVTFASVRSAAATASPPGLPSQETQVVLDAVLDHAAAREGRGPAHGAQLVIAGAITEWDLVAMGTATDVSDVPIGGMSLARFAALPADDREVIVRSAAEALPAGVVAHRVGDFVFTFHGMDLADPRPSLWVVVMCPDPDVNPSAPSAGPIVVGRADGTVLPLVPHGFATVLARQNRLRAAEGLAPLPDPRRVRHGAPAAYAE